MSPAEGCSMSSCLVHCTTVGASNSSGLPYHSRGDRAIHILRYAHDAEHALAGSSTGTSHATRSPPLVVREPRNLRVGDHEQGDRAVAAVERRARVELGQVRRGGSDDRRHRCRRGPPSRPATRARHPERNLSISQGCAVLGVHFTRRGLGPQAPSLRGRYRKAARQFGTAHRPARPCAHVSRNRPLARAWRVALRSPAMRMITPLGPGP